MKENFQPFILAVLKGEELIGIAPWCIHKISSRLFRINQIEFLGISVAGSDYLDVFSKRGKEREVARNIYDYLFDEVSHEWNLVSLSGIPADSLFLTFFYQKAVEEGKYVQVELDSYCPQISLPKSEDEFMTALSSNRREQFRRHMRILCGRDGFERLSITSTDTRWKEALERFFVLYSVRWGNKGKVLSHFLDRLVSRQNSEACIQIDLVSVEGMDMAGLVHLKYQSTFFLYLVAVDKVLAKTISVGNVLIGLSIKDAIRRNMDVYDLLKGEEEYKFHWANHGQRTLKVNLFRASPGVLLIVVDRFLRALGKIMLR